jgi:YjjG family noncanonical pyrimidine nucleotidase
MPTPYSWLWFDADGTLFDYVRAEELALAGAFAAANAEFAAPYLDAYRTINAQLWRALERHELTSAELPVRRFQLLLEALQLPGSAADFSALYLEQLALRADLIDGALEVIQALAPTHRFAIVTNGFQAVQRGRIERSPLKPYIHDLIISEEVGAAKPRAAFFEAAMQRLGHPPKADVLVIGDSLTSDMQGGVDFGLDTCWFNPLGEARPAHLPITYAIKHLRELLELVR